MTTKTELPLVTIGITCFNAENTIKRAVSSALLQDWKNIEIVIVDDASTDSSLRLVNEILLQSDKIKIIHHETNKGFAGSLNTIINAARGEFIAFFDDDDESDQKRISLQIKRLTEYEHKNNSNFVFCYSNRKVVSNDGRETCHIAKAIGRHEPEPHGAVVADYIFGIHKNHDLVWGMFGSGTMLARRSSLVCAGGYDENFRRFAEWDTAIRAALAGAHFISVDAPLMTQYKTETEDKANKTPLKYALLLRYKHKNYLKKKNCYLYSLIYAHAKFYYARGDRLKFRLAILLSFLFKPTIIWLQWSASRRNYIG